MSDYIVKIFSNNEKNIPKDEERLEILNQLRTLTVTTIRERYYDEVTFIDQGSNFEEVKCSNCGNTLEIDWWSEQMDNCGMSNFNDLSVTTPCCKKVTSLNDLNYIWPAGFARYVIEIINPDENEVFEIEKITKQINHKLVRAHY